MLKKLQTELNALGNPAKAKFLAGFFKTGKDQYAEGDRFIGVTVPEQRKLAKKYAHLSLLDLEKLLNNKTHEYRLTALLILVNRFAKAKNDIKARKELFMFYIKNKHAVNNWDLVDSSAPQIVGAYLMDKNRKRLYQYAKSAYLWDRRIAIVSTLAFIRNQEFIDTLNITEILLPDQHDLIHKASGWMLREVGKRNQSRLEEFLLKHHKIMPRTMLRYAIERLSENKKKLYMKRS